MSPPPQHLLEATDKADFCSQLEVYREKCIAESVSDWANNFLYTFVNDATPHFANSKATTSMIHALLIAKQAGAKPLGGALWFD